MPGPRKMAISKPKNARATTRRMLKDFKNERIKIIFVIILAIAGAVLSIITPIILGNFLNNALPKEGSDIASSPLFNFDFINNVITIKWDYFFSNFGLMLGLYTASAILSWASEFITVGISTKYAYDYRDKIIQKLDKLPLNYYDKVPYGDTLSVCTNDVDNVSRNLQSIIVQTTSGIALFLGSLIAMFIYDYRLAFIALITLPITLIIVFLIAKNSQKLFKSYRKELGILNGKVEEDYAGIDVIKLFNKEEDVEKEFDEVNKRMSKADFLSQFFAGFIFPTTIFINNVAYVAIAVAGGVIGQVGTIITFLNLLNLFTRPFQQIGQIVNIIQSVLASAERIYTLLDEVEEIPDKETAIKDSNVIEGEFDFNHVYFQYLKDKPLIEDFTLHVNKGDTVAIVGPTGAGKTTMVNLIMRFYEITNIANFDDLRRKTIACYNEINKLVDKAEIKSISLNESIDIKDETTIQREKLSEYLSNIIKENKDKDELIQKVNFIKDHLINVFNNGNIKLDNKTIFNYTRGALRGSVGMVLQDTWLFKGTIRENLLFGDINATDDEIDNALKEAHIYHFVQTLPGGLDFILNEDGNNVSQGQRQLLTIARAILSKPKIMILDEATSSVDTRTEKQIQDALDKIMKNRTSFVIAHRLSTIKNAKLIIVMKKGKIVEIGSHYELLAKNGFYKELYESQFSGNNPMSKEAEAS